jgi:FKBP-type peptidyl-prolyl cis-trans isomerase 2|tara:strand:+ start:13274 stop:13708 length:435 start_codon:yes stop_codon:yes gene_type:complete
MKGKAKNGSAVKVHYVGTFEDGTEFDNSRVRGQTLDFQVGSERLLPAFNEAVVGMKEGDTKNVSVEAQHAYGPIDPNAFQEIPKEQFGNDFVFEVGGMIKGQTPKGPFLARIHEIQDQNITLDFNHPLAGKDINFEIEMVSIKK